MRGSCRRLIGPHPENALCRLVLSHHHGFHVAQRTAGCSSPASSAVCTALTPALPHLIKSEGERDRKFADPLLKGMGFETAVPRKVGPRSRSPLVAPVTVPVTQQEAPLATRDREFESISLQRTVCLSSAAAFEGREPGFPRGFARMAWRPRRQRRRDVLISLRRAAMSLSGRIPVPQ